MTFLKLQYNFLALISEILTLQSQSATTSFFCMSFPDNGDHVKLTDFGVSSVAGEDGVLTQTEGTPQGPLLEPSVRRLNVQAAPHEFTQHSVSFLLVTGMCVHVSLRVLFRSVCLSGVRQGPCGILSVVNHNSPPNPNPYPLTQPRCALA